ncbi:MAG: nitroreductase family protein [Thermoleophilia bacterium]
MCNVDRTDPFYDPVLTRRSIRRYTSAPVSDEQIQRLLEAAMSAPSAGNQQPWHFIVVTDRVVLNKVPTIHPYAAMLREAPLAIVVCADPSNPQYPDYWVQDCSAATQNILIEARLLGLGSVWLGVHCRPEREAAVRELFNIPAEIEPLAIVAVGHPGEEKPPANRYLEERVHRDRW